MSRFTAPVCLIFVFSALSACGSGGGSSTATAGSGPDSLNVRVTAKSPMPANCNGAAQTGTLYTSAEVEPYAVADPTDPTHIVGAWQQDRWSNGGAQGLRVAVSYDSGGTWSQRNLPTSRCAGGTPQTGGDFERASDPWLSFSPNGVLYALSLSFDGVAFQPGSSSAMLVTRSTDGGTTWSDPVTLEQDGESVLNDKGSITADPYDPSYVYAVWDQADQNNNGPAYIARSTDGGQTWGPAYIAIDPNTASGIPSVGPGSGEQTLNNQIVVLPDGSLVLFYTLVEGGGYRWDLQVARSTDHGANWSTPIEIRTMYTREAQNPDAQGQYVRDGSGLGSIAVGPGGDIYVVWEDSNTLAGIPGILFVKSTDGGRTWSSPVQINGDTNVQAFTPTIAVAADGSIGVTYYDFHDNTPNPGVLLTDYWLARSTDGTNWTYSQLAGPFDLEKAPDADGLFLGDYQGLVVDGSHFVPFFVYTNSDLSNRTDVYTRPPQATAQARQEQAAFTVPARAVPPGPISATLRKQVHETIVRVMRQRIHGWSPGPSQPR